MRLHGVMIKYSRDDNGVSKPYSAGVWMERDNDTPDEYKLNESGTLKSRAHYFQLNDILDPKPEDDPQSLLPASDIALVKKDIAERIKDGIVVLADPVPERNPWDVEFNAIIAAGGTVAEAKIASKAALKAANDVLDAGGTGAEGKAAAQASFDAAIAAAGK
jgi:hypothetical protein